MERPDRSDVDPAGVTREVDLSPQPAPLGPPPHFKLSTYDIPPEGKFETWRDLWMRLAEVEVSTDSPQTFEGEVELWSAGPLSISTAMGQRSHYGRSVKLANNGDDNFSLTLCDVDGSFAAKAGASQVKQGGAFFISHDRPFAIEAPEHCLNNVLLIDRRSLLELMPRDFDLASRTFEPLSPALALVRNMVPLITNKTEPNTPERRETIGRQIADLVALMLNPSRDGRALIEARGLRAARTGAVLQAIDRHFANPRLAPETVAQKLGLSARQIHRLLEETTKTFSEHLLERKLQRAHELLTGGASAGKRIIDIAYEAGFNNFAHFSYTFRRRFGDTPKGLRETADSERALYCLRQSLGVG